MERGSSKHGPRLDEAMAAEAEGMVRAGRPTRVEEWRETEPGQASPTQWTPPARVPASALTAEDLLRELHNLHATRHQTLRHGSADALAAHTERTDALEREYLRRYPAREVDPARLRPT